MLRRQSPGGFNQFGEFEPGTVTETAVQVVTAPVSGEDRQVLPEGLRERNVRTFWLTEAVDAVVEGSDGETGDQIVFDGVTYQVFQVDDWAGAFVECRGVAQ